MSGDVHLFSNLLICIWVPLKTFLIAIAELLRFYLSRSALFPSSPLLGHIAIKMQTSWNTKTVATWINMKSEFLKWHQFICSFDRKVYCKVYTILYLHKMSFQQVFLFVCFVLKDWIKSWRQRKAFFLYFNSHYNPVRIGIMTSNEIWFQNVLSK